MLSAAMAVASPPAAPSPALWPPGCPVQDTRHPSGANGQYFNLELACVREMIGDDSDTSLSGTQVVQYRPGEGEIWSGIVTFWFRMSGDTTCGDMAAAECGHGRRGPNDGDTSFLVPANGKRET